MASAAYALPLKTENKKEKWMSGSNLFADAVYYSLLQELILN